MLSYLLLIDDCSKVYEPRSHGFPMDWKPDSCILVWLVRLDNRRKQLMLPSATKRKYLLQVVARHIFTVQTGGCGL